MAGADLADTVLATSIVSGPDPRDPGRASAVAGGSASRVQLTVGFSADLGCAWPDAPVAGRLQALAAAGMIRLSEVAVRLADPAPGWLPLAVLDRGEVADLRQVACGSLAVVRWIKAAQGNL
jgi:hypothetical protein